MGTGIGYGRNDEPDEHAAGPLPKRVQATVELIFEARGDIDQTEGRGGTRVIGYSRLRSEAAEMAKGQGAMGTPGQVHAVQAVFFDGGGVYVLGPRLDVDWSREKLKASALAKLTPEERKALGLT